MGEFGPTGTQLTAQLLAHHDACSEVHLTVGPDGVVTVELYEGRLTGRGQATGRVEQLTSHLTSLVATVPVVPVVDPAPEPRRELSVAVSWCTSRLVHGPTDVAGTAILLSANGDGPVQVFGAVRNVQPAAPAAVELGLAA